MKVDPPEPQVSETTEGKLGEALRPNQIHAVSRNHLFSSVDHDNKRAPMA